MKKEKREDKKDFLSMMVKKAYSQDQKPEPYSPKITAKKEPEIEPYNPKIKTKKDKGTEPYSNAVDADQIKVLTEEIKSSLVRKKK